MNSMLNAATVLDLLREQPGQFISGETLSETLGVSRTAVWKHIHQLGQAGYIIQALPHKGYCLQSTPDKLLSAEIQYGLTTRKFGRKIVCFQQTSSTNDRALELAEQGYPEGTLVAAEDQTHGRGRHGRRWLSPAYANLLFSLIFRPPWIAERAPLLTLIMAVAVADSLSTQMGVKAKIKWPNDIVIEGAKVAGILTEMRSQADAIDYMVCGVGVNVNAAPTGNFHYPVTCLAQVMKAPVQRLPLLRRILERTEHYYLTWQGGKIESLLEAWRNFSCLPGARIQIKQGAEQLSGRVLGMDENGALWLCLDNGIHRRVTCGELEIFR